MRFESVLKCGVVACAIALCVCMFGCSSTSASSSSASSASSAAVSSSADAQGDDDGDGTGEAVEEESDSEVVVDDSDDEDAEMKDVTNVNAQVNANDNGNGCTAEVLNKAVDGAGYAGFTLKVTNKTDKDLNVINGAFTVNGNAATAFVQDQVKAGGEIESFVFFFNGASSVSDLTNVSGTIYLETADGEEVADFAISF